MSRRPITSTTRPNQPIQPQIPTKTLSKEVLGQWQSIFNMMSLLLKSHNHNSTSTAFHKLKRFNQIKKKYSTFLANKLNFLQKRKARDYMKWTLSALQSNKINFYTNQKQEHSKLKQNIKNKAASLIGSISAKLNSSKRKNHFQDLRGRTSLSYKMKNFKTLHICNLLAALGVKKVKEAWNKIGVSGKNKIRNLRRLSRVQKLITVKSKNYMQTALLKLRINVIKSKTEEMKEKETQVKEIKPTKTTIVTPPPTQRNNQKQKQLQSEVKKLQIEQKSLNQKKKTLEKQLTKIENDNQRVINDFKRQIQKLQHQNSELMFNHDLLEQNNLELEGQFQNKQKPIRNKLSKGQIWQNVYSNLIHFLSINKDKPITKAALLECLEMPLVPCGLNIQELNEENQILNDLLSQYKKNFPEPQISNENTTDLLPFDVIRKQNRYYYMVLEVLSEWGLPGSKEFEQLNNDLTVIQKKLVS